MQTILTLNVNLSLIIVNNFPRGETRIDVSRLAPTDHTFHLDLSAKESHRSTKRLVLKSFTKTSMARPIRQQLFPLNRSEIAYSFWKKKKERNVGARIRNATLNQQPPLYQLIEIDGRRRD